MRKRGFTLLELTYVVCIIAILAAILFPVFAGARETARRAKCANNLQQIGVALAMYAQNYDGHYPRKNNEFGPLYNYARCTEIFYCPSDSAECYWDMRAKKTNPAAPWDNDGVPSRTYSSYVYRGGLSNDDRADTVIAGESQVWHRIANVLYLGGYVRGVLEDDYKPVVRPTQKPVEKTAPKPVAGPPAPPGPPGVPPTAGPAPAAPAPSPDSTP